MAEIIVRPFREEDADAVYAVALDAWKYTYRHIFDADFIETFVCTNYTPERLIALLPSVQTGQMFFDVAVYNAQIVGFCHIGVTNRGAELFRIYLLPSFIGQGIGWRLLQRGEAFVVAQGLPNYFCFVHKDNELGKQFYLRHGLRHIAEQDHDDEWYMEKALQ